MKTARVACYFLVALLLAGSAASAQDSRKTIVLIFPMKVAGISLTDAQRADAKDYLGTRLTVEGVYSVMPESQVKQSLGAAKTASYQDCYDEACRIDMTKTVYADKSVSVEVGSEGSSCRITAVLYDIAQEATESAADVETGCGFQEIKASMVAVAAQLSRKPGTQPDGKAVVGTGLVTRGVRIDRGEKIVNRKTDTTGLVFIDTNPTGADIQINGKPVGTAPYQASMMVGKYVVIAELNSYYHIARHEIDLTADGASVMLELPPAFGEVKVNSDPEGADVLIDNKPVGKTPYHDARVISGVHSIEVRKSMYMPEKRSVQVVEGQNVSESFSLREDFGGIRVTSEPAGATVILDGKDTGRTTPADFKQVKTGTHVINLDLAGHGRVGDTANVVAGQVARLHKVLEPKFGTLVVMTRTREGKPCQGKISVDGVDVGRTPWKAQVLAVGHKIVVDCGGRPAVERRTVEHNQVVEVTLDVEVPAAQAQAAPSAAQSDKGMDNAVDSRIVDKSGMDVRRKRASFQARLSGGLDLYRASEGVGGLIQVGVGTGRWFDIHTGVGFPSYSWVTDFEVNLWPYGRFVPTLAARVGLGFHPDYNVYSVDVMAGVEMWMANWAAFFVKIGVGYSWNRTIDVSGVYVPGWLGLEFRY